MMFQFAEFIAYIAALTVIERNNGVISFEDAVGIEALQVSDAFEYIYAEEIDSL